MPSRSHSSVQRTRSLPVHTSPQTMLMFQQPGRKQAFAFLLLLIAWCGISRAGR